MRLLGSLQYIVAGISYLFEKPKYKYGLWFDQFVTGVFVFGVETTHGSRYHSIAKVYSLMRYD